MKKRMFNDRYCLTRAVLSGDKTMTRSIIHPQPTRTAEYAGMHFITEVVGKTVKKQKLRADFSNNLTVTSPFNFYEEVAVAQSYREIGVDNLVKMAPLAPNQAPDVSVYMTAGMNNKMFVKAEYMPHRIRIDKVKVERLQDISAEDCLKEGIRKVDDDSLIFPNWCFFDCDHGESVAGYYLTPQDAFAALIDAVMGKGTWESNPWVWVYEFTLIK